MFPVISIANKETKIGICVFDGDNYQYYSQFYDDIYLSKTIELVQNINPKRIVSSVTGLFKITLKRRFDSIHFMNVRLNTIIFNNLSSVEHKSIKLISNFLNHKPILKVENNSNIIGYADKFPILTEKCMNVFINEDIIKNIHQMPKLDLLLKNTITKFGKLCIIHWISNPCIIESDIQERRSLIQHISSMMPKIKRLLKDCKFPSFDRNIHFYRLRRSLKASLLLQRLIQDRIKLKNKKSFLKLYKMLRIFDSNGISDQKDPILDGYRNKVNHISTVLEKTSKNLAIEYNIPLSTVYFPNIGFYIESSVPFDNLSFVIGDKFYSKNNEMNELDRKYGDPYHEINMREASITVKIMKKILKIDFSELYELIGCLDASVSLYISLPGHFAGFDPNCDSFELSAYECFNKKTVLTYKMDVNKIIETIIIHQIGGMVSNDIEHLPVFKNIAIKRRSSTFNNEHMSTFQNEVIILSRIFRNMKDRGICIIEGIGESTSPREGISLLAAFVECILCDILIISTEFQSNELKEYLDEKRINIVSNKKNEENICDLFTNK